MLTIVLIMIGLGVFIGLYSRRPNPPRKPLLQTNMANTEAYMPLALAYTRPIVQRPLQLAHHQPN